MLCGSHDAEAMAARACGLSREGLRHLRSLIELRGRNSWAVGDVLVAVYGSPGPAVVHDGSRERLGALADELGVSVSWLTACRATGAAWPPSERRPTVAWAVSRHLAARPDRFALLDAFCRDCSRAHVTPSRQRLVAWLDQHDRRAEVARPALGRPRQDPIDRLVREALRLDRDALARLIERLSDVLAVAPAA
jgi:hypothetical protein